MITNEKDSLVNTYVTRAMPIPTLPSIVSRILELSSKPDVKVEEVADAILTDKVLTARMIRLVNSAFWGIRRRITSIREAIVYLGLHQIRSIVLTTSLFNTFPGRNPFFDIKRIWEHGLGVAMVCRSLAEKIGYEDAEKAYIAGLMHDIGEVLLSQYSLKEFEDVVELVKNEKISFYDAENRVMGVNHTDFAEWFGEHWGFSEEYVEVIKTHHTIEKAKINPPLVAIVYLSDLLCRVRGLDYGFEENIEVVLKDEPAWKILVEYNNDLAKIDIVRFTLDMDALVEEVKGIVKDIYNRE